MREIAEWWKRRSRWTLGIRDCEAGSFQLDYPAREPGVTLVARGLDQGQGAPWFGEYHVLEAGVSKVQADQPPWIEVSDGSSPELVAFLRQEGFPVLQGPCRGGLRLDDYQNFSESDKRPVLDFIERNRAPLVRLWRWPNAARSALAITGDIDSMTLGDFFRRPFEV
jgi:hypothetical protein